MTNFSYREESNTPYFIILAALFLMWGLITVMSGFLIPELMDVFELNYYEKLGITMSFFGTYLFVSFPAGQLIDRVGFKNGIISGASIAALGCLLFYIAAERVSYSLSVVSLFTLASGITILQVGANSYAVLVGRRGKGAQRLTFLQSFNALGAVFATIFASSIINVDTANLDPESIRIAYTKMVEVPFLTSGGLLLLIAMVILFIKLPGVTTEGVEPLITEKMPPRKLVWEFPHVAMGCTAIFAYVGAEVTIFQFLLSRKSLAIDMEQIIAASKIETMITIFWIGLMAGRFAGAALLSKISPRKMMTGSSIASVFLILAFIIVIPDEAKGNWMPALWIITVAGLFSSVLFPCIFTMAMDGLGKFSEEASSILIMSIGGGAIIPFLVNHFITSNPYSVKGAFVLILISYLFIVYFGVKGSRYSKRTNFY
jgi:MFS transporter, FHS family, L-fucose permease